MPSPKKSVGESIELEPLASETLGVRSMAVRIGHVVIDPSASLAPKRFGLPPHPKEWEALVEASKRIVRAIEKAEVVVITHYHRDHYNPGWLYPYEVYDGKKLIVKDYKNNINVSQKIRAYKFFKALREKGVNVEVEVGDGKDFGDLELSPPLVHGDPKLGYVLAVKVDGVVFSSDVQGGDERAWSWFGDFDLLLLDGPPIYLNKGDVEGFKERISRLENVVVDHHSARQKGWREALGVKKAYSDLLGVEEKLFEACRKELYEEYPVEDSWLKMKFSEARKIYFPEA